MQRWACVWTTVVLLAAGAAAGQDESMQRRVEYRRQILNMLPPTERGSFVEWVEQSGALPPDFDQLPARPYLMDPLTIVDADGQPQAVSAEDWPQRRAEIADLVEDYLLGHAPPPPDNLRATVQEDVTEEGYRTRTVLLEFGPDHAATLTAVLTTPAEAGDTPLPVYLCPSGGWLRLWQEQQPLREMAYCWYGARDWRDQSEPWEAIWPDCDWSAFRRRGWAASRVLDWLETVPDVDATRAYLGGHSRSAKQAMAAMAFDERFAGIIASSPGSGGSVPFRYCDGWVFGESIEILTRAYTDWMRDDLRFYVGRANQLPADTHLIYALMAPRPVLMSTGLYDWVESTWSVEQIYHAALPVYQMLGKPENLALRYRPTQHRPDEQTFADYRQALLNLAAGGPSLDEMFPFEPIHPWSYDEWAAEHAGEIDVHSWPPRGIDDPTEEVAVGHWPARRQDIRSRIDWLLGEGPDYERIGPDFDRVEPDEMTEMLVRNWPDPPQRQRLSFGEGVYGTVYWPENMIEPNLPAIVLLAPFATSSGYTGTYLPHEAEHWHVRLAAAGFVVLAFDPIGTGGRQIERREFYERHPDWSLMGKMVLDARHAVDALEAIQAVDHERIYLFGFGMGAIVAEFAAAVDDRPAGTVSIAGLTPMRTDPPDAPTGGARRWSHLYGWLPRVGPFVGGNEARIPVDLHEMLACVAPRPMLVVDPRLNWHADHEDLAEAAGQARRVYQLLGRPEALTLDQPDDWCRLSPAILNAAADWLQRQAGLVADE